MAEATFTFRLVTPQRLVLETPIVALQAPGSEGYLGVLANHAALVSWSRDGFEVTVTVVLDDHEATARATDEP